MSEQEKKDKKFSMIISGIIHVTLIALFLILVAWREPDPPIPEYGIELNFGLEEQGGGDTERDSGAKIEDTTQEEEPDTEVETEVVEEVVEETEPDPVEEVVEEVTETEPEPAKTEEVTEEVVEVVEDPVTTEESEVAVEEEKKETEEKKEEVTPPKEEIKKEEPPKEKPKEINTKALMGGKKTDTDKKDPASNNQGDERALMGNQGDPEGKKNTQGNSPGGADLGGVSYSLDGWKWQRPPAEKDDSQIDGVIKFAIEVDDRGDVLRVSVIPGTTISDNTIVEFYKKQVQKLRFVQLDPSKTAASVSKGEVTFVIKTN